MILRTRLLAALCATCFLSTLASAQTAPTTAGTQTARTIPLPGGGSVSLGSDGIGWRSDASGVHGHPVSALSQSVKTATGATSVSSQLELQRRFALPSRGRFATGRVVVTLDTAQLVDAGILTKTAARGPRTSDPRIDVALRSVGARTMRPLSVTGNTYVVDVGGLDPLRAAAALRATPGVLHARPDFYVSSMATPPQPLPAHATRASTALAAAAKTPAGVPANYGVQSSLQSHLNANGTDAVGAFVEIARRWGEIPGEGIRITNVSVGDITDQSMADAGDWYVQQFGATTRLIGNQRYLDYPAMPLIPTYTVSPEGYVDGQGIVEYVDPYLSEVLLDFSVMAPLPHDRQRAENPGVGPTDLLGIAPGAQYRLVVPQEPTISNIYVALLAAAQQQPRPDVITASLGYGFDNVGFPGRYLEDDPVGQAVIAKIVRDYGIVVCISSNDGTRLYTNAAVGPDGGSAPTNLLPAGGTPTSVADDAASTTPTLVADSGAFAVGGTTLDDIFSAPPHSGGPLSHTGQFPTTRLNGGGGFSSGFGSRINISAPSDNIVSIIHACNGFFCNALDAIPVLSGGTSASAPMVAAAAAVVLQVARHQHVRLTPAQVRDLLVRTARVVPDAPQSAAHVNVGPQLDVTAAVLSLLSDRKAQPQIARLSVAHRQPLESSLGAMFISQTDPANIDLLGPDDPFFGSMGQNVAGPITLAADVTGARPDGVQYALRIGALELTGTQPFFRLLPIEILAAAGLPLASNDSRQVTVTLSVKKDGAVLDSASRTLVFGPTDGTYSEALAPIVPATVTDVKHVYVAYDLRGVRQVNSPALIVSSINHFSPTLAPNWRQETTIPLDGLAGIVRVPASAFAAGAGIYGLAVMQDTVEGFIGEFAILRVANDGAGRPPAPLLADTSGAFGHGLTVDRAAPKFSVRWDARGVTGADGAVMEVSAPGPTLFASLNTFTNANGDRRDQNGNDSASTLFKALPSVSGTATFDAAALGLPSAMFMNVRVLATRRGKVVGEASATSALEFDEGLAPGGLTVTNFDIAPGGTSSIALTGFDPFGQPAIAQVTPYTPATATYGAPFAQDAGNATVYAVIGSDPSLSATLVAQYPYAAGTQRLEIYDPATGVRRSSVAVDPYTEYYLLAGRVDAKRHRAALLAWNANDYSDNVLPLDMNTGALRPAIPADGDSGMVAAFTALDIDASTGRAVAATEIFGDICIGGRFGGWLTTIDLDAGVVAPMVKNQRTCITGLASDQAGGNAWLTIGPLITFPSLLPPSEAQPVDEATLSPGNLSDLGARSGFFPVIDPVHKVLVVGFVAGSNIYSNNNAMSAVGAYDLVTGSRVYYSETFNFVSEAFSNTYVFTGERGIQLDPATRTGYTFGPGGAQIEQFKY